MTSNQTDLGSQPTSKLKYLSNNSYKKYLATAAIHNGDETLYYDTIVANCKGVPLSNSACQ